MAVHGTSSRKAQSRRYYLKHRDEILAKRAVRRAEQGLQLAENHRYVRAKLQEYVIKLKNRPCMDCGQTYPSYVMDFDHVRGEKRATVSQLVKNACSLDVLQDEIAKCDVVCSNCHRIRTHTRHQCGAQQTTTKSASKA